MIKQSRDNGVLYSRAAAEPKIITMKVSGSHNNRLQSRLDLLKNCILQLPVILQPSARDSNATKESTLTTTTTTPPQFRKL